MRPSSSFDRSSTVRLVAVLTLVRKASPFGAVRVASVARILTFSNGTSNAWQVLVKEFRAEMMEVMILSEIGICLPESVY